MSIKGANSNYIKRIRDERDRIGWNHINLEHLSLLMHTTRILTIHRLYEVQIKAPERLHPGLSVYFIDRKNDVRRVAILRIMDEEKVWVGDGVAEWMLYNEQLKYTPIPMKPTLVALESLDQHLPMANAVEIWQNERNLRGEN